VMTTGATSMIVLTRPAAIANKAGTVTIRGRALTEGISGRSVAKANQL
jgi:hypothetical protein